MLMVQDEHWQLMGQRMFSLDSMASIPTAAEELSAAEPSLADPPRNASAAGW
jgi:hypothetical protein